jgi:RNA polymerase sigma factor (sigma-70 family)
MFDYELSSRGSNLGTEKSTMSEADLEDDFGRLFRETEGRVFVTWSAQNIGRTVTLYRACLKTGRTLAIDLYTAEVLRLLQPFANIPQPGWPGLKVVVTGALRRMYRLKAGIADGTSPGSSTAEQERLLVSEVLRRDRKATAEFVAFCTDSIYAFVRRRLMPRVELVEDMMQEILLAAWQGLENFRGEASLRSWCMGIARHKLDDYYRKRLREVVIADEDVLIAEPGIETIFDQGFEAASTQKQVEQTIALLPEPYALALIWRYRDEKSLREMAELCGRTEKAMERLLARARENFRRRWNDVSSRT